MMAQTSQESKLIKTTTKRAGESLPWWTWVLPLLIANLGTWLSLWLQSAPGVALWYLPTAFGIVMAYWWGPRVLLGIYLNAVICAPLWDLPWQFSPLYALPETLEVGLSWLFFVKLLRGKVWLPNLENNGKFIFSGSILPNLIANIYLVWQVFFFGDIARDAIWDTWRVLISADLAAQFVFTVPALLWLTKAVSQQGWSLIKEKVVQPSILAEKRANLTDVLIISGLFIFVLIVIFLFPVEELWILFGLLMVLLAIRYGVYIASLGNSWVGILTFLSPVIKSGAIANPSDFLMTNLGILLLSGVALVTGRAISDLSLEVQEHKRVEESLRLAESRYRTLVEQTPPIVYMSAPDQHIGATYVSPRIQVLGFTQAEWIADPQLWFRQIHPDDQQRILNDIEAIKQTGKSFKSEYRIRARDGREFWFLDEAMDIVDEQGKLLFRQGFMLDITDRKQAEDAVSSREKFLALLNDMTQAILTSSNIDDTLQRLAFDLKKIIDADDCYILYWDEDEQLPIPVTTTAKLGFEFSKAIFDRGAETITSSILKTGRVLAVDDLSKSRYASKDTSSQYPSRSVIGIPLIAGNHKLGAAIVAFNTPHKFTENEIERARQAGGQVALALWDIQQSLEIKRRLGESKALSEIGLALSETERVGIDSVLQLIVDSAINLIEGAQESVIHLLDAEQQALIPKAISGFDTSQNEFSRPKMRFGEGVAGQVMRTGETINVGDIIESELFLQKDSSPRFRSLLVAPVRSGGQQIGTISVQSDKVMAFSNQDVELLNALSVQATIAIENTRLFEATEQSLKEANALYRTSQGLVSSLDTDELLQHVVDLLHENFAYYHVQIYLVDTSTNNLILKSGSGEVGHRLVQEGHRLPLGQGIVGHVFETAAPFVTNNVNDIMFFFRNKLLPNTQSEMTVPIKVDGQVVGVIDIQEAPPRRLTDNDLQLMVAVSEQLSVALQKASLYTNLENALHQEQTIRTQLMQSERLALVGRLLASVSHELNNPLQAIQNALFLIKDEEQLSEQGRQDLAVILAEAERMAALIERLRSAYRPGQIQDVKPMDINDIIENVHALISTHMRQKEIAFEFHPGTDMPLIAGLSEQIHQVLLNLFLNAVDVMGTGGRLTVLTRNWHQQNEILLTVKDTGPGIDPAILPVIFDAFVTDKLSGTGLGLAITRDIIEQHLGRIEAMNDPQGGAVFNVWLPVHKEGQVSI
jgi:PAS domain S-box-containing protein